MAPSFLIDESWTVPLKVLFNFDSTAILLSSPLGTDSLNVSVISVVPSADLSFALMKVLYPAL